MLIFVNGNSQDFSIPKRGVDSYDSIASKLDTLVNKNFFFNRNVTGTIFKFRITPLKNLEIEIPCSMRIAYVFHHRISSTEYLIVNNKGDSNFISVTTFKRLLNENCLILHEDYYKKLLNGFGIEKLNKIMRGETWIGMSEFEAILAWGNPVSINTTKIASGVSKQYVYDNKYLYIENEKLKAIQE